MQAVWTRATAQPWTRSRSNCSARPRSSAYSASVIVPAWRRNSRRNNVSFRESRFEFTSCVTLSTGGGAAAAARCLRLRRLRRALRLAAFGSRRRRGRAGHFRNRLAQEQTNAHGKDRRKAAEQNPFLVADARRSGFNRRLRAGVAAVHLIRAKRTRKLPREEARFPKPRRQIQSLPSRTLLKIRCSLAPCPRR